MTNKELYAQDCFDNFFRKLLAFKFCDIKLIKNLQHQPDYTKYGLTEKEAVRIETNVLWNIHHRKAGLN